jgi:hypothetical protein
MTTEDYNYKQRQKLSLGAENSEGVDAYGFADPNAQYPSFEYFFTSNLNKGATGQLVESLWLGGASLSEDLNIPDVGPSSYPMNQAKSTSSGHHLSFDDTPGNERVLIKHRKGSGVEVRADGTVIVTARENRIEVVGSDHAVFVEGNGKLVYKGNLNLDVTGDLNINCLDFNLNARGSYNETIGEHHRSDVGENKGTIVKGNQSNTVLGVTTDTHLKDYNQIVKGNHRTTIQSNSICSVGGSFTHSADTSDYRTNTYKLDANTYTVLAGAGQIGGENVVYDGLGATFSEGVTATVFSGNLNGKAETSGNADWASGAASAPTSAPVPAYTVDDDTPTITATTAENQTSKLLEGTTGVKKVVIDDGDFYNNFLDKLIDTDGVSVKDLTGAEVALLLEDNNIAASKKFLGWAATSGKISTQFSRTTPPAIGRIVTSSSPVYTSGPLGSNSVVSATISVKPNKGPSKITPDPVYNPMSKRTISADTKLAPGVPISKFAGTVLLPASWKNFPSGSHKDIARNLYPFAQIYNSIRADEGPFSNYVPEILAGLYTHKGTSTIEKNGVLDLASQGRAMWIRLRDSNTGKPSNSKTFELARYIANTFYFDELRLHYKLLDVEDGIEASICLLMPNIPTNWNVAFRGDVFTYYNNQIQGENGELMEVLPYTVQSGDSTGSTATTTDGIRGNGSLPTDKVVIATNPDPKSLPKQNIIDAIASAVRSLGVGYQAKITGQGGWAEREDTNNHPVGDAADHYLIYNGTRINPETDTRLYKRYITLLVLNAYNKGIRPGIGGYGTFIHYDESPWRANLGGLAGYWNSGFNVENIIKNIKP